jgi:hypothetical protein
LIVWRSGKIDPGSSGPIMSGGSFQEAVSGDETSK